MAFPPLHPRTPSATPSGITPLPQQFLPGDLVMMAGEVWQVAFSEPGDDCCHLARHISVDGAMVQAQARYAVPKCMLTRLICTGELQHFRLISGAKSDLG